MSADVIDFPMSAPPTLDDVEKTMSELAERAVKKERAGESAVDERSRWHELHEQYQLRRHADSAGECGDAND